VAAEICSADGVIPTIGKHVIAENTLAGGNEGIGVDESADCGVVITGLQVIEAGIIVIVVTATSIFIVHIFPDTVKKNI
jgi:hypothetical protein